jgi:hypothetical protein
MYCEVRIKDGGRQGLWLQALNWPPGRTYPTDNGIFAVATPRYCTVMRFLEGVIIGSASVAQATSANAAPREGLASSG